MTIAFVFPGQGAQYAGMGKALAAAYPAAREVFTRADAALEFPLSRLCWDGPDADLMQTASTQPAILTTSIACLAVLRQERGPAPVIVAGLSLGEYSALVCAEAIGFEDAVRAVRRRGQFMQEAAAGRRTAMAAVLGLDADAVRRVCAQAAAHGIVEPSNFNSPGQVVIAGDAGAVEAALALAKTAGARRAVLLPVSAPFHTSLMRPAATRLAAVLATVPLRRPRVPVVSNVTARPVDDPQEIQALLVAQVASPVRWDESVTTMVQAGVTTFVEVGPGTSLSGLIRKTVPQARTLHLDDPATLRQALAGLAGEAHPA